MLHKTNLIGTGEKPAIDEKSGLYQAERRRSEARGLSHFSGLHHLLIVAFSLASVVVTADAHAALSADAISAASGVKASMQSDGVVRIGWPRNHVEFKVDGVPFKPFAGLGSWAAFKETANGAIVMGDSVVFRDEVDAAMDAAFANGLEVTALHNHFFYDEPKAYFMHIGGHGDPVALAKGVGAMWSAIKAVRAAAPIPASSFPGDAPAVTGVNAMPIEKILGTKANASDGMLKFSWARDGSMGGTQMSGTMGLSTWASFTGNDKTAVMAGDFIMHQNEVQPVLHALRAGGIHVVALHNHMIGEQPADFFVHYWGKGGTKALARGLKAALDAQMAAGQHTD